MDTIPPTTRPLLERQLIENSLDALKDRKPPRSVEDLKPRTPTAAGNWLEEIRGKWPGDETDEQIERALEEMS